jgi:hypothetical protein
MEYLDKIFLWLGNTSKTEKEFGRYFKLDYSENDAKVCGFCLDIDKKWYDEDFIGYLKYTNIINITKILEEVPINPAEKDTVIKKCNELGFSTANAVFWYSGEIKTPKSDKNYNDLFYIGEFMLD